MSVNQKAHKSSSPPCTRGPLSKIFAICKSHYFKSRLQYEKDLSFSTSASEVHISAVRAHTRAQCHNSALLTLQVIRKITSVAVLCEKDTNNCHENAGCNNIKHMLMKRYSVSRIWNLSASSGNDNTFLRSCEKAA